MADEEIVSGLKQVKDEITQQRNDSSKQSGQLTESINKLRSESNQKSDGIVGTLTSSFEDNAAEVAAGFILQRTHHSFLDREEMTETDNRVATLTTETTTANIEQKSLLQRIAAFVNPDMQGSQDRERDLENKANTNKQTEFFSSMAKSLAGMVIKPIRTTAAGIWTFLKGLAFGGALLAILNFLDGDTWKDWQKWIVDELPKKLATIKDAFVDEEGNITFFKGLKQLAVELGLVDKEVEGVANNVSNWGIAAIVVSIGAGLGLLWKAFKGIRGAMIAAGLVMPLAAIPTGKQPQAKGWKGVFGGASGVEPTKGTIPGAMPGETARPVVRDTPSGPWKHAEGPQAGKEVSKAEAKRIKPTVTGRPMGGVKGAFKPLTTVGKWSLKILRKIPWIGKLFAVHDIMEIIDSKDGIATKTAAITKIIGGLGGSVLGGILGGGFGSLLGLGIFSPITGFFGTAVGAWLGYKYGEEMAALAVAQFLTKQNITAYDEVFAGWDIYKGKTAGGDPGSADPFAALTPMAGKTGVPATGVPTGGEIPITRTTGKAKTTPASLAAAITPPPPQLGLGRDDVPITPPTPITVAPKPDRAGAMTDWSVEKSAQAYNGGGAGVSTNVIDAKTVDASKTVYNYGGNQKNIANPSPLLNAVNATMLT
jgi:hypothetical protein